MFFQAVRLTLDVDNGAVMQYLIQDGGGNGNVGKDLVPLGEGLVSGKCGRCFLVPSGNELTEQVCALDIHREIFKQSQYIDCESLFCLLLQNLY